MFPAQFGWSNAASRSGASMTRSRHCRATSWRSLPQAPTAGISAPAFDAVVGVGIGKTNENGWERMKVNDDLLKFSVLTL